MKRSVMVLVGGNRNTSLFLVTLMLLTASCDPSRVLIIDGEVKKEMDFKCGSIEIGGVQGLGSEYGINIFIEANDEPIDLSMEDLQIFHKDELIPYSYSMKRFEGEVTSESMLNANEKRFIGISINKESVIYGDTLLIDGSDFLMCDSESVFTQPLKVVLRGVLPKAFQKKQN